MAAEHEVGYEIFRAPVDGGALAVGRWGAGETAVVASHGITANHVSWQRVGQLVAERSGGDVSVVAVDHRGRAGSADVPGPCGMAAHGQDLIAVLDHLEQDRAVLLGHSMGGFVAAAAAEAEPDRVAGLVLVDGGLPFPLELPPDADVETVVQSVIGPALDRLDQRWATVEDYVDFFRNHPAFTAPNEWPATAEDHVRYDAVVTPEGEIRSSVSKEAVLIDGGAAIVDPASSSSIERIATPALLLWAPRGLLDQTPGLYTAELIEATVAGLDHLNARLVMDTNHYTIAVGEHGAAAVADAVLEAAAAK